MDYLIRVGLFDDKDEIEALLPRLADFKIPAHRSPEQLWHGDRDMVRSWAAGKRSDVDIAVAVSGDSIVGIAIISERAELFSGAPSAHLETLAIDQSVEGQGIASALMRYAEEMASARSLQSMSLNVFAVNDRARALYERHGYDGEVLRYFKPLT